MNNSVLIFKFNPLSRSCKQCGWTRQLVLLKHPHEDDEDDHEDEDEDEDDHEDDHENEFHGYLRRDIS